MALTLSHQSALDVIRTLRSEGHNLHEMDTTTLAMPSTLTGKRWSLSNFTSDSWRWQQPTRNRPLHVLVPSGCGRLRGSLIREHVVTHELPANSIIWLDAYSSVVCPELLFLQLAAALSLPALVMLGHELCGHFSRSADEPRMGDVTDGIAAATSVSSLERYLLHFKGVRGLARARDALRYVHDHAISAPEALLATMYALPPHECGYGLGSVLLNDCVRLDDSDGWTKERSRYPDLMLTFAPVGINYDGSKHFDLPALLRAARELTRADASRQLEAWQAFSQKLVEVRAKVIDDNMRNRQLAVQGKIVFPATKEDVADGRSLDSLTRQILCSAHSVFGVDVDRYLQTLDDTSLTRDRWDLLDSLLPNGRMREPSYGKL